MAAGQLLLKKGVMALGNFDLNPTTLINLFFAFFKNIYLFAGLGLIGVSFVLWLFILSKVNLGFIYPISASLTLSLVVAGSFLLFKENVNSIQVIGIAVIIAGIFLTYYKNSL